MSLDVEMEYTYDRFTQSVDHEDDPMYTEPIEEEQILPTIVDEQDSKRYFFNNSLL